MEALDKHTQAATTRKHTATVIHLEDDEQIEPIASGVQDYTKKISNAELELTLNEKKRFICAKANNLGFKDREVIVNMLDEYALGHLVNDAGDGCRTNLDLIKNTEYIDNIYAYIRYHINMINQKAREKSTLLQSISVANTPRNEL
jgi:hypothetical protein